jgi:hypothetical protein
MEIGLKCKKHNYFLDSFGECLKCLAEKQEQEDRLIQEGNDERERQMLYNHNLISAEKLNKKPSMDDVWSVFLDHPVYVRLRSQIDKGLNKYDTPVNPSHYSVFGWFEHLQQENTDKIVYNEIIKMKLGEAIEELQQAYKAEGSEKDIHISNALSILLDKKAGNN